MEEAYMDWEIEGSEDNGGKMSWVLDKAITVGKKILITGFVMTSAPVVLPPLMVISAIGFVCSVPYGLLFASYACTQKVMSTLLPSPAPSSLVECEPKYYDGGGAWEDGQEVVGFGDIPPEDIGEDQLLEEPEGGVEMRQQPPRPVENKEAADVVDADLYAPRAPQRENKQLVDDNEGRTQEQNQYAEEEEELSEEIVEESDETGEQKPAVEEVSEIMIIVEGDVERNESKEVEPTCNVTDVAVELFVNDDKEGSEIVRETIELIETIGHEDQAGRDLEQHKRSAENAYVGGQEGEKGITRNAEEMERAPRAENGSLGDKQVPKSTRAQKLEENGKKASPVRRLDENEMISSASNVKQPTEERAIPVEGKSQDSVADVVELPIERKVGVSSSMDAREIADESGFDIFDKKTPTTQQYSYADSGIPKGTEQSMVLKPADALELTIPPGEQVVDYAGIPRGEGNPKTSKVLYREEEIWKQIHAVRRIVGYTAARRATCSEELKSLYIFTGVEPPSTFNHPSELEEVSDKLRFLMSIVGVK